LTAPEEKIDPIAAPLISCALGAIHLLSKLVKANLGYGRKHRKFSAHQAVRRIVFGVRRKLVEISRRGQEDRDKGNGQECAERDGVERI